MGRVTTTWNRKACLTNTLAGPDGGFNLTRLHRGVYINNITEVQWYKVIHGKLLKRFKFIF